MIIFITDFISANFLSIDYYFFGLKMSENTFQFY